MRSEMMLILEFAMILLAVIEFSLRYALRDVLEGVPHPPSRLSNRPVVLENYMLA